MPAVHKSVKLLVSWGAHTVLYYVIGCSLALPIGLILPTSAEEGASLLALATLLFVAGRLVARHTGARVAAGVWILPLVVVLASIWGDWNLVRHSPYYRNQHVNPSAYIWHHYLTLTTDSDCQESECLGKLASDIFIWSIAYSFGALTVVNRIRGETAAPPRERNTSHGEPGAARTRRLADWLGYVVFTYLLYGIALSVETSVAALAGLSPHLAAHALLRTILFPVLGLVTGYFLVRRIRYAGDRWVWAGPAAILAYQLFRAEIAISLKAPYARAVPGFWRLAWGNLFSIYCRGPLGFCPTELMFTFPLYFALGYSAAALLLHRPPAAATAAAERSL